MFFGRTGRNRFDAPDGEFGVLYVADSPHCAFIETYGRLDHDPYQIITMQDLVMRNLSRLEFEHELTLVDLTGSGLARLGADSRLWTGDYRIAQRWSIAL